MNYAHEWGKQSHVYTTSLVTREESMIYRPTLFLASVFFMALLSRTFATTTKQTTKIAVVGCGVSGSAFVRELLQKQNQDQNQRNLLQVDVFDIGRTPGGRASSMTNEYGTWDMGAQYISKPKTEDFKAILNEWVDGGRVEEWKARIAEVDFTSTDKVIPRDVAVKKYYVGVPSMQSICTLVEQDSVRLTSECNVKCLYDSDVSAWKLTNRKNNKALGVYDWIVCTDRPNAEEILRKIHTDDGGSKDIWKYCKTKSQYTKSLSCMIAIRDKNKVLHEQLPFEAIRLSNHPVLSYVSIESSKPSRKDVHGSEIIAITLQSSEKFAKELVENVTKAWNENSRLDVKKNGNEAFWNLRLAINKACEKPMYDALYDLMNSSELSMMSMPFPEEVMYMRGFRWGRSFPINSWKGSYDIREDKKMLMIGDYFDVDGHGGMGRIETSAVSARRGAQALLKEIAEGRSSTSISANP